jgi:hypothetical protein
VNRRCPFTIESAGLTPLDEERARSMADEGGASAAAIEGASAAAIENEVRAILPAPATTIDDCSTR